MARIDIRSNGGGGSVATGVLQLQGGVAMTSTLTAVTDQNNTTSPLKLSTTAVQVTSTLKITTSDNPYIDAEDSSGNNRFTIGRDPSSQIVNVDFASNPTLSTEQVGSIRTYTNGVALADVMSFRRDGNVGIGTNAPAYAVSIERTTGNAILSLQGNAGTFISISRFSDNSTRPRLELYKSRGTISTPAVVQTNDELGSVDFYGYNGSANQRVGILLVNAESVVGSTITPQMGFGLGTSSASTTYKMVIKNDGNVTIGNEFTSLGARLGIKGSGSTVATTSLLIQNSLGNNILQIGDSGLAEFGTTIGGGGNQGVNATAFRGNYFNSFGDAYTIFQTSNSTGNAYFYQNVSIGSGVTPVASAALDVVSTTKGFLPPRMTTAQKNAIASPASGLMVYDTDLNKLCVRGAANWETITSV